MLPQHRARRTYTEGDVYITISNITSKQIQSERRAVVVYNVPRTTVQRRRARTRSRRDCELKSKRLTKLEEEVIVQRILKESERGVPSSKVDVRDMANKLLRERGGKPIGKNWVDRFIKRTPKLRTRWSRPYDYQRAACEAQRLSSPGSHWLRR